jgi:hypothetical protein
MNSKHRKTLIKIFDNPVSSSVYWKDIEKLFVALDCTIKEGRGSRVRIIKDDIFAVFHRPHPEKETNKGAIISVRDFLSKIGEKP